MFQASLHAYGCWSTTNRSRKTSEYDKELNEDSLRAPQHEREVNWSTRNTAATMARLREIPLYPSRPLVLAPSRLSCVSHKVWPAHHRYACQPSTSSATDYPVCSCISRTRRCHTIARTVRIRDSDQRQHEDQFYITLKATCVKLRDTLVIVHIPYLCGGTSPPHGPRPAIIRRALSRLCGDTGSMVT